MNYSDNIILMTDSYKYSHIYGYPPDAKGIFSYIESRGGRYDKTLFFGLQIYLKKYLSKLVTMEMVDQAEVFVKAHGEPFNRSGWEYIVNELGGKIPVTIKAVPEGTLVPVLTPMLTVECTNPKAFWIVSHIETSLLRSVWYGTTVASQSKSIKNLIYYYLKETSDDPDSEIAFKLNDFGARGTSSHESAEIGGAAHLVNFMGSDTVEGVLCANYYYDEPMAGFSIPASEHSTITSWGKDHEVDAYRNMLRQFAKPGSLVAIVSDSYDIYNACSNIWGGVLKDEVINSGATVIIRPDSGDPATVVSKCAQLLEEKFGSKVNSKGYKVLNNVRLIQGDGINEGSIQEILLSLTKSGFSATNIAFGMGGALLQKVDRDTQKFAMKCSSILIGDEWRDVYKEPITDPGKNSKAGRLEIPGGVTVFKDGEITKTWTFKEVRETSNKG